VEISVPPPVKQAKHFPPSMKKGKANDWRGKEMEIDIPDGMIGHLTRDWGGNEYDGHVVDATLMLFEKEIHGANPCSKKEEKILGDRKIEERFWCIDGIHGHRRVDGSNGESHSLSTKRNGSKSRMAQKNRSLILRRCKFW
jgi:hypothetical protein